MADISIRHVEKSYGKQAVLLGIDLEIADGTFAVILGPSGCGKSTLLRMIAGLETISSGEIAIAGRVVNKLEPRERGCAMVFQNYALYPHMTVAGNIGYALKVAGVGKAERARRVAEVAQSLALTPFLDRRPGQLSGGQRQRVAMGRAMIREPGVFLYDEPLSNLDAKLRVQMRAEIRKLHVRLGATSVFVTHDQVEAMSLADQIIVMNGGMIEQVGTPQEVYRQPASCFIAGFIGSPPMNLLEARVTGPSQVSVGASLIEVPAHDLPQGSTVLVGLRPEDAAPPGPHTLTIGFIEELGAQRCFHGGFEGQDFIVQQPSGAGVAPRERLAFSIPRAGVHLFNAATGRRLGAPHYAIDDPLYAALP